VGGEPKIFGPLVWVSAAFQPSSSRTSFRKRKKEEIRGTKKGAEGSVLSGACRFPVPVKATTGSTGIVGREVQGESARQNPRDDF